MKSNLKYTAILLCCSFYGITASSEPLSDASKYTVRVKTSISHAFAEDEAGTYNGAGFLVDVENRYIVTNAHVSGYGNANIRVAFEEYEYEDAKAIYVDPVLDLAIITPSALNCQSLLPTFCAR